VSIHGSPHAGNAQEEARTSLVVEATNERPDAFVENKELGAQIEHAIGLLRPEYRTVVLLRHVEGYSYEEIAETTELPLGTVKTYLHRARNELKDHLAEAMP
jgi:RNA polymerase sigma-70 factor (ECF subfamily)